MAGNTLKNTEFGSEIKFSISGMTCASCAARIQRKIDKNPDMMGSVNYATETARVQLREPATSNDVIAMAQKIGFTLVVQPPPHASQVSDIAADAVSNTTNLPTNARNISPEAAGEKDSLDSLRTRLIIAATLTIPIILISMIPALQFAGWHWLVLAMATPVVGYCGWTFHRTAAINLRHRATSMDTLVSLGTIAAFVWSYWVLAQHATNPKPGASPHVYFEAAAGVTLFVLAGRYFELRSRRQAGAALRALLDIGAKQACVVVDGVEKLIPVEQLQPGNVFVVRPGEKIATDGVVVDGRSAINNSLVTGESVPVDVGRGDAVIGAALNTSGRLTVETTKVGAQTQLAQMARLVEDAQSGKAAVQRLVDRISTVFVPIVLALSISTLAGWLLSGAGVSRAFEAAVAVLIIACPCALGLATPMALLVGTGRGAALGILIRGPEVLEATKQVGTIVLDKTGTVTTGHMQLEMTRVDCDPEMDTESIELLCDKALQLAASVEQGSEHPIARAIVAGAQSENLALETIEDFQNHPGQGACARVGQKLVYVGKKSLMEDHGLILGEDLQACAQELHDRGFTTVLAGWDGEARAAFAISDQVKPTSQDAVRELKKLGLEPVLLTGDNQVVAQSVADDVGIERVIADVSPADKVAVVAQLQGEGRQVAMVGDGVNDAAALAQADLGLAMGSGSDAAIEAADITLVHDNLQAAVDAIRLARRTLLTIRSNLFWAFAYNVAAIPLAMAGLLNPMIAGAAMALSSAFVVANSLTLRTFRSHLNERENGETAPVQ